MYIDKMPNIQHNRSEVGYLEENMTNEEPKNTEPLKTETPQVETKKQEPPKIEEVFRTFKTQEDFDNEIAKVRGSAERNAKKDFYKMLGIDSEEKIEAMKKAYQDSLTESEKQAEALKELENLKLSLAEKEATIAALKKFSNKGEDEITKIVKMAKGLVGDGVTLEQAIDDVMKMFQVQKPTIPTSQVIATPPANDVPMEKNPFKENNMTEMGKLIKENPEKARQLAKEANYAIKF